MSRSADRQVETELTRIRLLEADADQTDDRIGQLIEAVDGLRKLLVGALFSTTTAAVLLVINLTTGGR